MPRTVKLEDAKVHLHVLGRERHVDATLPAGQAPVTALLPLARELTAAISSAAAEYGAERGDHPTCSKGCGACCRQIVPISSVEAHALAAYVDRQPGARQSRLRKRFAAALSKLEEAGLLDASAPKGRAGLTLAAQPGEPVWNQLAKKYFAQGIACPFLEDESCSAYADRPMVCREFLAVTPPDWCNEVSDRVRTLPRPTYMGEALAATEASLNGGDGKQIPLVLALEWVKVHGARVARLHSIEEMFHALMARVDTENAGQDEHERGDEAG